MSVKVGVRVRPFNQRQKDLNCRLCVDMNGPMTRLFDADDPDKHRDFTFDYSFWSHDQFYSNEEGYFVPQSQKYADQKHVFEQVGLQILQNAWQGYHCCLFAYGQTGAGKSYSMVGYGANKGIVPISCEEIFRRITNNENKNLQYELQVSMLQIYNEKVQDLLIPISKRAKQGLKIRQHKVYGIYVEGLSKHYVETYDAIEHKMQEGGKNRSIAATEMNANSSRAHTIISLEFKQLEVIEGKKRQKLSVIHLVDLAGSQKVGKTGATGDRLKEAAGINKSLTMLGMVISKLAQKAMGKAKGQTIPYRDSCLTRILQNALGGNSKTLMICAISPATDNYEQTLSTLRYADQAKKIQNKAVINESQTDKVIRNLTEEKEQLREKVAKMQEMFKKLSMGLGLSEEMLQQFNDAKQQLRVNTSALNDYTLTKSEKIKKEQGDKITDLNKIDLERPHLSNLNEDPQLSRKINYSIDTEQSTIGRRNVEPPNDISIGGMGIRQRHAKIIKDEDGKYFLAVTINSMMTAQDSGVYVNGDLVSEKTELKHLDRLTIGTNNMFVVLIPHGEPREQIEEKTIDWDFSQNQLYLKKQTIERKNMQEKQRQIKEETQRILKQKQQQLARLQETLKKSQQEKLQMVEQKKQIEKIEKAELQKKVRQQQAQKLRRQIQKSKNQIKDSETQQKEKIKQKYYFEKKLLKTLPKCIQLNLIAKEFKRNISMSVKMLLPESEQDDMDMKKRSIKVKVVNRQVGYTYWWDTEKLSNRYYIIKDMSEQYFETGNIPTLTEKDDPFWDPPEHSLIGRAFLTTKALAYMFDNPVNLTIIGQDDHCGQLNVNLVPTDQTGSRNLSQQMEEQMQEDVEFEPEQLIDKPFHFNLFVQSARIPDHFENIYVEYGIRVNEYKTEIFKTNQIKQRTRNPTFNYKRLHHFQKMTKALLDYLSQAKLIFKIYGWQMLPQQKKQAKQKKVETTQIPEVKKDIKPPTKPLSIETMPDAVNAEKQATKKVGSQKKVAEDKPKKQAKETKQAKQSKAPKITTKKQETPATEFPKKKDQKKKDKDCIIY